MEKNTPIMQRIAEIFRIRPVRPMEPARPKVGPMEGKDGRMTMCVRMSWLMAYRTTPCGLLLIYADGTREEIEMGQEDAKRAVTRLTNTELLRHRMRSSTPDLVVIGWTPGGGSNLSPTR